MKCIYLLLWTVVMGSISLAAPDYQVVFTDTPADDTPCASAAASSAPKYTLGLSAGVGIQASGNNLYTSEMLVTEGEVAWQLSRHHALTCSLAFGYGEENNDGLRWDSQSVRPFTDNFSRYNISLMAGYRYTQPLGGFASLQLGVKAGPDLQSLKVDFGRNYKAKEAHQYDGYNPLTGKRMKSDRDDCTFALGLAYAAYANLSFSLNKSTAEHPLTFFVGYALWGSTARPEARLSSGAHPIKLRSDAILRHEIRIGLSCTY